MTIDSFTDYPWKSVTTRSNSFNSRTNKVWNSHLCFEFVLLRHIKTILSREITFNLLSNIALFVPKVIGFIIDGLSFFTMLIIRKRHAISKIRNKFSLNSMHQSNIRLQNFSFLYCTCIKICLVLSRDHVRISWHCLLTIIDHEGVSRLLVLAPKSFALANTNLAGCLDSPYQMKPFEAVFLLNTDEFFLLVDSQEQDDSQGISPTPATRQGTVRILNAEFRCLFLFSVRSKCLMWFSLELFVN